MFAVPNRQRLYRRLALGVLGLSVVVFIAVGLFGILMPVEWGHYGHHLGEYILRARGTVRHHTMIPTQWAGPDFPPVSSYYLHHGILTHHFLSLVMALFGERLWLVRLIPMSWCLVSLLAIFVMLRRHWSNRAAAAGALTYATLAFTGTFLIHYDPGQLALPAFLVGTDAWLRYRKTPRFHLAAAAVAGFAIGGMADWSPYFNTTIFVPIAFLIGFSHAESHFRRTLLLRPSQWLAFFIGLGMVTVLAFHFWFTWKVGGWQDLMGTYKDRSSNPSWEYTIDRQYFWLVLYFGKPFVWLAGVWLALLIGRLVTLRASARDLIPFTLLAGWCMEVFNFPTGSNIHAYRVLPIGAFIPLMIGDLVHRLPLILRWMLERLPLLRRTSRLLPALVALAGFAWLLKVQIPTNISTVREGRRKAGTIEFEGYNAHLESFFFADQLRRHTPPDALVIAHSNLGIRPEFQMIADREFIHAWSLSTAEASNPVPRRRPMYVVWDNDWLGAQDRPVAARLVAKHGAYMIGPFVLVDLASDKAEASTWQFDFKKPTRAWKYFVSWDYPPMFAREGTRPGDAAWLGSLGVKVVTRNDVPEPSASDLPGLVGYIDYLRVRGDDAAALQRAEQNLRKLTQPGPTLGPFDITGFYNVGRDVRLVLGQGTEEKERRELRVLFTPEETAPAKPRTRRPAPPRREPMLRSPAPMRPEWDQPFWKKGLLYVWDVPTNDLDRGSWGVSALLFEGGKAPAPTVKSPKTPLLNIPHKGRSPTPLPAATPPGDKRPAPGEPPAPPPTPEPLQKAPVGIIKL